MSTLLIFGTSYAYTPAYPRLVYPVWFKCLQQCEDLTQHRVVMVDANSAVEWETVFPCRTIVHRAPTNELFAVPDPGPGVVLVVSFRDNIGHVYHQQAVPCPTGINSHDGAGRALCQGIYLAAIWGIEYFAHVEGDAFLFGPRVLTTRLKTLQKDLTAPNCNRTGYLETNLLLGRTETLRDFSATYDWQQTPDGVLLERRLAHKFAGRFEWWEIPGGRGREYVPSADIIWGHGGPYFWTCNRRAAEAARFIQETWRQSRS